MKVSTTDKKKNNSTFPFSFFTLFITYRAAARFQQRRLLVVLHRGLRRLQQRCVDLASRVEEGPQVEHQGSHCAQRNEER